jgi:hypothetical protein
MSFSDQNTRPYVPQKTGIEVITEIRNELALIHNRLDKDAQERAQWRSEQVQMYRSTLNKIDECTRLVTRQASGVNRDQVLTHAIRVLEEDRRGLQQEVRYQQDQPARELRNHGAESNPNDYSARATQRGFRERLDDLYTEPKNDDITREHRQEVQRKIREMTLSKCTPWLDDLVTPAPQEPIRAPHPTPSATHPTPSAPPSSIAITRTVGAAASYKPRPTPRDTAKQRQISQKDARNLLIAQKRTMEQANQQEQNITSSTETWDDDMGRSPEFTVSA